jgi:hypothetical protein
MADEAQYSSGSDTTNNKHKYEDPTLSSTGSRRPIYFSAILASALFHQVCVLVSYPLLFWILCVGFVDWF